MTGAQNATGSVSRRAAIGAAWIIAWRLATRNIGLLSTLILVRLLQPADFGLVALATGFIGSVDALSAIGVQDALVRAPDLDRAMYDTGFSLNILRGILTALLIAAIAWPVANFFDDQRLSVVMLALSVGTLVSAFENIGVIDFRRDLAFRKEFAMQLWSRAIGAMTTVAIAAVWHSYWALIAGILVYRAVRLIQSYRMSSYRPRLTVRSWRRILGFSLWTWGQTILYQARERADGIVIGRILGAAQVGVFSIGAELGSLPATELVEPLGRALFSGFAALHNASMGLANMFVSAVGLGIMLILPMGVGISMVADPMVRLSLGGHWVAAVPVVQIMAIGATGAIFTQCCGNLLNAIGRASVTLSVGGASAVTKYLALALLVPDFGLPGAAVAWLIASAVDLIGLLWLTLPRIGVSLSKLAVCAFRPTVATMVMVVVLWHQGMAWTPGVGEDIFGYSKDAATRSAIGAVSYGAALLALWAMAGRPDGPERLAATLAKSVWTRLRRMP